MGNNGELIQALDQIEKEKSISKDILIEAIENSLVAACKNHYGKADNIKVNINRTSGEVKVYAEKVVVEEVTDPVLQISLLEAQSINPKFNLEDTVNVEVTPRNFGRIAAQKAKQVVVQKIREEERKVLYNQFYGKEKDIVTGVVQRYNGKNISINLGKVDAVLSDNEQVRGEVFSPNDRIKLYVVEVKNTTKGPRITVSRKHPELVKRLFESEVTEVKDGTVEIKSIAREPGSRTKMAVYSNDPDVDPVGACVGINGTRVNEIVQELRNEKIDIINWSEDPAVLIENALSPSKVISVEVFPESKSAKVVVPDYQLSLAIGREGQNARLAAKLTGYKIDIKSESQSDQSKDKLVRKEMAQQRIAMLQNSGALIGVEDVQAATIQYLEEQGYGDIIDMLDIEGLSNNMMDVSYDMEDMDSMNDINEEQDFSELEEIDEVSEEIDEEDFTNNEES